MKKYLLLCFMLMFAFTLESWAQERTVSGKVTSIEDGSSLPGVNVVLKGTTQGTVTDVDGNYKIGVPQNGGILVYSFIGLASQEIEVGARSVIDIQMTSDIKQLSEVVVTAFGVEREKKSLGYAVQELSSEELVKGQTRSPVQSLQGKIAGVQIGNASGALGASTTVVLRGTSSLTGNNQALFIVDGIPINNTNNNSGGVLAGAIDGGNAANDIDPENIASVTVLKGASASALYGSRAANGVIVITTKKGKNTDGKINIDVNSSVTFDRVLVLPNLQNKFGQGQNGDNQSFLNDQESWGDAFDGELRPYGSPVLDPNSPNYSQIRYGRYVALKDNVREFFDIGKSYNNSISLSGGTASTSFRLSFSDLNQTGVIPETGLRRNTVSFTGSTKMTDRLTVGANMNYIHQNNDLAVNGQGGAAPYNQISQTSRSVSITEQRDLSNPFNSVDWYYTPFIQNPYFNILNDSYDKTTNRVYGNFNISYKPIEFLTLTTRVGTDVLSDDRSRYRERRIASPLSPNSGANDQGFVQEESYTNRQVDFTFNANFNKDLTEDININLLAGYNFNQRSARAFVASVNSTSLPDFHNIGNSAANPVVGELKSLRRLMGAYAQLDLSYKGFLFLGATFRNDWSSTLPSENRSFNYPGVNLGFVLTDAIDLGLENILSFVKFRASYAEVGLDAPVYSTQSVFIAAPAIGTNFGLTQFPLNGVAGFTESNVIGNPTLRPELTKELEFGADFRFFNGRFNIDAAYFDKSSTEQIVTAAAPPSSGFSAQVLNVGEIANKGIELLVSGTPLKMSNGLELNLSVNYTKIDNEVVSLNEGATDLTIGVGLANYQLKAVVGQPYGVFEAPTALRDPNGNYIVDGNGLPQQAANPAFFGNIQPDWLGGVSGSLSFKGLTLSATFEHKEGGKVYSRTKGQIYFNGAGEETAFNNREQFIVPNSVVDNGDGTYSPNTTVLTYASNNIRGYWNAINGFGEVLIIDASYTKLRELSLSYTLPKNVLGKLPINSANVSLFGRNLWIDTPSSNTYIDPEVNSFSGGNGNNGNLQGFEFGTVPSTSSYGASVRLTF
ncbi:MAG TPA: SusC/RagA family TonB-linked outer membrane protein [Fulvivirga sp.]|nr:SusC/RagA family TonB-linked outer membrane protein [Fulvivirga sp.]